MKNSSLRNVASVLLILFIIFLLKLLIFVDFFLFLTILVYWAWTDHKLQENLPSRVI